MGPASIVERTSDGEVATAGQPRIVYAVTLTAGTGAAGTAAFLSGGSGGTTLLTLRAPQGESVTASFPCGAAFGAGCYVDLTGTGAVASVAFS